MPKYNQAFWEELDLSMNDWGFLILCHDKPRRYYSFDGYTNAVKLRNMGLITMTPFDPGSRDGTAMVTPVGRIIVRVSGSYPDDYPMHEKKPLT